MLSILSDILSDDILSDNLECEQLAPGHYMKMEWMRFKLQPPDRKSNTQPLHQQATPSIMYLLQKDILQTTVTNSDGCCEQFVRAVATSRVNQVVFDDVSPDCTNKHIRTSYFIKACNTSFDYNSVRRATSTRVVCSLLKQLCITIKLRLTSNPKTHWLYAQGFQFLIPKWLICQVGC